MPEGIVCECGADWLMINADFMGEHGLEVVAPYVDDALIDPPYELEAHEKQVRIVKRQGERRIQKKKLDFAPITEAEREFLVGWCKRNVSRWAIIFGQLESMGRYQELFNNPEIGTPHAAYRRSMSWIKPNGQPQKNGKGPAQGSEAMATAWCGPPGKQKWNGGGRPGTYTIAIETGKHAVRLHPSQKPLLLMEHLVRDFTNPGEIILDTHTGSGQTGVAALKQGRRFIGWEKDPRYFERACRRLATTPRVLELAFGERRRAKQMRMDLPSRMEQAHAQLDAAVFGVLAAGPRDGVLVATIVEQLALLGVVATENELRSSLQRHIKQGRVATEGRTVNKRYSPQPEARTG